MYPCAATRGAGGDGRVEADDRPSWDALGVAGAVDKNEDEVEFQGEGEGRGETEGRGLRGGGRGELGVLVPREGVDGREGCFMAERRGGMGI